MIYVGCHHFVLYSEYIPDNALFFLHVRFRAYPSYGINEPWRIQISKGYVGRDMLLNGVGLHNMEHIGGPVPPLYLELDVLRFRPPIVTGDMTYVGHMASIQFYPLESSVEIPDSTWYIK